jgi:hypothetical protein
VQSIVDAVEIVEQSRHGRDLDDLTLVVVVPEPREERVVDAMRIECELPGVRERGLLLLLERTALEFEQALELLFGRTVPRSLRGMRARSVLASIDSRYQRRHELLRSHRDRARVRDRIHVRDHRLQDLRAVRVDAEHVRHVAALRADLRVELADLARDFVF